jgi:ABC-type branched-subunit amino acid transport system ATPase component
VKGWDASGKPVELLPWQELAVTAMLGWDRGIQTVTLVGAGRGAGKTTVLCTVGRYIRARATGRPLADDPVRQMTGEEQYTERPGVTVRCGLAAENRRRPA